MVKASLFALVAVMGCDASNRVTVLNESGRDLDGLSLAIEDQSFRLGPLADGASRSTTFDPNRDSAISLCGVQREGGCAEYGYVTPGLIQTHHFEILADTVRYSFR